MSTVSWINASTIASSSRVLAHSTDTGPTPGISQVSPGAAQPRFNAMPSTITHIDQLIFPRPAAGGTIGDGRAVAPSGSAVDSTGPASTGAAGSIAGNGSLSASGRGEGEAVVAG